MDRLIEQTARALRGEMSVPGDKSISHRSVMLASLANGSSEVNGFLNGADCLSTIACFRALGIQIELSRDEHSLRVYGRGLHGLRQAAGVLDCGNSGTTTRLMSGILAAQPFASVLDGDESIRRRPMGRVMRPLRLMGAQLRSEFDNDCAPLHIQGGELCGISYDSPVASAQVKSAILLAGLFAQGSTVVREPYLSRNHTELMLSAQGVKLAQRTLADGRAEIQLEPAERLTPFSLEVPGDISSAAYFISAALMLPHSELLIRQVGVNPSRDGILEVYRAMGAQIELLNERKVGEEPVADIWVKHSELRAVEIGGSLIPRLIDELPVIAACAVFAQGTTVIRDAAELKHKESNRISAMVSNLKRMGVTVEETEDGMRILGGGCDAKLEGARIDCHRDHRLAMSFALLGLRAKGETLLEGADCIQISYPNFFEDLDRLLAH